MAMTLPQLESRAATLRPTTAACASIGALLLRDVPGIDVTEFVAEQGREFRFVVQFDHDAARDAHGAAGKGVGIHVVGVERTVE